jgi:PmbA protein
LLGPKVGQQIAAPCLNLIDEARHAASLYQPPFDSEGVSTKKTSLLDQGMLAGFLHNRKTAAKAGCSSTGNGFRPSWKAGIQVSATNSYFQPGKMSREALYSELDRGLLVTELTGLHAGTNLTSGDFSLSAEGFWLEKGEISYPVEQITVAGNFYELMRQVQSVADDLFFDLPGGGQVGSPSLLIESLSVSGQ